MALCNAKEHGKRVSKNVIYRRVLSHAITKYLHGNPNEAFINWNYALSTQEITII